MMSLPEMFMEAQNRATEARNAKQQQQQQQNVANEIARLKDNVTIGRANKGRAMGQTQVAIDIIMQLTNKNFEEVREMIVQHSKLENYTHTLENWAENNTSDRGLLLDGRTVVTNSH